MFKHISLLLFVLFCINSSNIAQTKKQNFILSGNVIDEATGQALQGASIYFPESVFKKLNKSFSQNEIFIQDFVNHKIDYPLEATKNKDEGDHFMKRELRISPYLVGKIFHLNAVKLFYLQSAKFICLDKMNWLDLYR